MGWRRIVGGLSIAAVLVVSVPTADDATAAFPGLNGRIVYASDRETGTGESTELYSIAADGSDGLRLTSTPGNEENPTWSSNGTRIAFDRGGDLFVIDADGSDESNVTSSPATWETDPAWSPDGSRLAFARANNIFTIGVDGTNEVQLTHNTEFGLLTNAQPAWSPDGQKIAFAGTNEASAVLRDDIWVINADGSGVASNLTDSVDVGDRAPAWSPDGTRLVWSREKDEFENQTDVWVMNANGSGETQITTDEEFDAEPAWSPDGSRIAFRRGSLLYTMDPDGSDVTQLTSGAVPEETGDRQPDWGVSVAPQSRTLSVSRSGEGDGSVTSAPDGISCGIDCANTYADGTSVVLTAIATTGSTFEGWVGCDIVDADSCTVEMSSDRTVTATFGLSPTLAPIVTNVVPGVGSTTGGTQVTITGTNFAGATAVTFGDAAASFVVDSDEQITAVTPAHPAALVDVAVTGPNGTSANTAADDFDYVQDTGPGEGTVEFSTPTFGATETDGTAEVRVRRTGSTHGTITVDFATSDGTAVSRSLRLNGPLSRLPVTDYVSASGTLVFGDGESEQTFTVPIVDDDVIEGDETIDLTLSDPASGGTLGAQSTALLTLADNDPSVSFVRATSTASEGAGVARIDVELSVATPNDVSVAFAVTGGTAAAGQDHLLTNGTLRFRGRRGGVTLVRDTIRVPLVDDDRRELPETLLIELSNPTNAFLGSLRAHTLTIEDDDPSGDLAGHTPSTAFFVDLVTQPRQVLEENLPRALDPADMFRMHLDAGDRLALDVDPQTGAGDPLGSSTLVVLAADGTTQLARVGRSREPDTGAFSDNPAFLFTAPVSGDFYVRVETRDFGRLNGYTIEFHRLALSQGRIAPAVLDERGAMYAGLDGNVMNLTGPTGYGFALEGAWTREATFDRRSGRTTTTYRVEAGQNLTLHTALGELTVPVFEDVIVPTAASTWGATFGRVTSPRIRLRVGLPLSSFEGELFAIFNAVFQYQGGTDIDTWYVELGDRILRQTTVNEVLRGVPYLRSSEHTLLPIHVKFGPIDFQHAGPLTSASTIIADLADPYLYVEHIGEDRTIRVAFSRQGYVPFRPLMPPTDPEAVGLDHIYGHVYTFGGGIIGSDLAPIEVFGGAVEDLDANDDGAWLAGLGNADQFVRGDLSAIGDVFQDVNRGLDVEVNVHYTSKVFDLRLPLGKGSALYNGAEGALWFRVAAEDPFAGTPLAFVRPTVGAEAEGVIRTDGSMSFTVQGEMSLGDAGDLGVLVHLDDDGIEAEIAGEIELSASASIDGVGATCTARARAEGTVRFSYASGLRTSGSLRLDGRVTCEAGGQRIARASFDVGAAFDSDSITVDLPYIGDQTLAF